MTGTQAATLLARTARRQGETEQLLAARIGIDWSTVRRWRSGDVLRVHGTTEQALLRYVREAARAKERT